MVRKERICPKCKKGKLVRFGSPRDRNNFMDECSKCDYEFYSKGFYRSIGKSLQDAKEGRSYLWSCATKRGMCVKSGQKPSICHECCSEQSKRWYGIGKKDGRKVNARRV